MTLGAGIDLGSTTLKLVLVEEGRVVRRACAEAGARPREAAVRLLESLPPGVPALATGYGRDLLEVEFGLSTVTEIKAHAAGARHLAPDCTAVVDVGGQDVKVIQLDGRGRVARFEMNDRCAAGTGRFLEVMARRLGYGLDAFAEAAAAGADGVAIHAMCAVFAESEVVGLLNRGRERADLARALHVGVAARIAGMFGRVCGPAERVLCTGGGARNRYLVERLERELGCPVRAHVDSQVAGALGCALLSAGTVCSGGVRGRE